MIRGRFGRGPDEHLQVLGVVDDLHRPAAQDVGRAHDHRVPDPCGDRPPLFQRPGLAVRRRGELQLRKDLRELPAVLGQVDRLRPGAEDREPLLLEDLRQPQRRLPAELHDHPHRALRSTDRQHVLRGHRLEVEPAGRVVVGRDRLRVAVHHHRLEPSFLERECGVHARVVELDPLADPVRTRAQDHDPRSGRRPHLRVVLIGGVVIRRPCGELPGARVDGLEHGHDTERLAMPPNGGLGRRREPSDPRIRQAEALRVTKLVCRDRPERAPP